MTNLDRALAEISAIRNQMAHATEFRGYGPLTSGMTGLLAIVAAICQADLIKDPAAHVQAYLLLWGGTAALSAAIVGAEMVTRSRRLHSNMAEGMIRAALGQLLPAMAAGGLITLVLMQYAPQSLWMLPGLWQILFSLGVFASCRSLPRSVIAVGVWYLACGLACLALAQGQRAFSPWTMGAAFGVGQWLAAILLQRGLPETALGGVDDRA